MRIKVLGTGLAGQSVAAKLGELGHDVAVGTRDRARVIDDPAEAMLARHFIHGRYCPRYGGDLTGWRDGALPVAIDLEGRGTS